MGSEKDYQQAKNFSLPYLPQQGKSVVYLSQGYQYVDWVIGAGTLAEGSRYRGSRVFVKSSAGNEYYIGTLHTSSLCFYAPPGHYQVRFENKGAQPEVIQSALTLNGQDTHFLALQHSDITDDISLKNVTSDQGKFLVHAMPPKGCTQMGVGNQSLQVNVHFNLTLVNHTAQPMQVALAQQTANETLLTETKTFSKNYTVDKDNTQFTMSILLTNLSDHTQDKFDISNEILGLNNNSAKKMHVDTYTASYRSMWKTSLRTKTICHSNFQNRNFIQLACKVELTRTDPHEHVPERNTQPDQHTSVYESGVN